MAATVDPNKAKTARRVIEVLEYFDEQRRHATVMDIARRYKRPQSSTSELLAILVEMGLLYKDPTSRSYTPTPWAAMLGSMFQPGYVRDGRLSMLMDRLSAQTGLGTALLGMVGLTAQIYRWVPGPKPVMAGGANALCGGMQKCLGETVAGWLLMGTLPPERRDGTLRRLRAEAPADRKFTQAAMSQRIQDCGRDGSAAGPSGFSATTEMAAILLPAEAAERPLVLGFIYEPSIEIDPANLIALLQQAVSHALNQPDNSVPLSVGQAAALPLHLQDVRASA
jgi:DNA-binding IclR family transcriptional regulator